MLTRYVKTTEAEIKETDFTVGLPNSKFKTLSEAYYEVPDDSTLWVGPGKHYVGCLDPHGRSIRLVSTDGPEETHLIGENRSIPVFVFQNEEMPDCIVEGFTISNGKAPYGGGMFIRGASPTVKNVIIRDNKAKYGGGVFACHAASPQFVNVCITDNSAERGGGMYSYDAYLEFSYVTFLQNQAEYGGGLELRYPIPGTTAPASRVFFRKNKASKLGGGLLTNNNLAGFLQATFHENTDTDIVFRDEGFIEVYPLYV